MIRLSPFAGMAPRVSGKLLSNEQAQLAKNCKLKSGELRALRGTSSVWTPTKVGNKQSIHLFAKQFWFHWLTDVDVVRGAIPSDTTERTYYTGDGAPKVTNAEIATQGESTNYPNVSYLLGVPAPEAALSAAVVGGEGGYDPVDMVDRFWVYTYVSAWGEEGPPSPPSLMTSMGPDQTADLSGIGVGPTGAYNIATKRIYRSSSGNAGAALLFEAEIPVAQDTYSSTATDDQLGEEISTTLFDPPPETLKGLTGMANGMMAGFTGKDVWLCEPYQPHAWPEDYRQAVDFDVVGLASFGTTLVVTTEGYPYVANATDPMSAVLQKIELEQACVSKRSIVSLGSSGAAYASPDGLVVIGPGGAMVVTEGLLTRDEWQAYQPDSMIGCSHDGQYIAFYNNGAKQGGLIIDPRGNGLVEIDLYAVGAHVDLVTDSLYLLVNNEIVKWDAGDLLAYAWKSKRFTTPPLNFPAGMVVADSYDNLTMKVYADQALKHTQTITDARPFRLPAGFRATEWEIQIEGTDNVHEARLGTMGEMA